MSCQGLKLKFVWEENMLKRVVSAMTMAAVAASLLIGCGSSTSSPAASSSGSSSGNSASLASSTEAAAANTQAAAAAPADAVTIKVSSSETQADVKCQVLDEFEKEVVDKTGGAVQFENYYSNELGSLDDVVEQISTGANIMVSTSGDFFADYGCPDIASLAVFYALPTTDAVQKMNDSDLFKSWCDQVEKSSGIKILCCNWAAAPRNIISTKPINSVADIKNLKIRVPGAAADAFFSNLGAATVTMPFSDVYTGLQQGTIEAAEASLSGLYTYSLQEVAKNVYLSQHSFAPTCFAMSSDVWNSISPENQKIFQDALVEYGKEFTKKCQDTDADYQKKMEDAGVKFVTPSDDDKSAMQKAGAASFSAFPNISADISDQIAKIIN